MLPAIIMLALVVGAITGIALTIFAGGTRKTKIPFGPFLAVAGLLALLNGDSTMLLTRSDLGM